MTPEYGSIPSKQNVGCEDGGGGGGSPGEEGPGRSFERLAFRFVQAGFLIRPSVPRPNTPEIIFI